MAALPVLTQPTFQTGANDGIATADIYNLDSPGVITNIANFLETLADDVLDLLKGGSSAAADLPLVSSGSATSTTTGASVNPNTAATATAGTSTNTSTTTATTSTSTSTAVAVDQTTLVARLITSSTAINSALKNMSTAAQANMTSGLDGSTPTTFSITLGTVTSKISSTNYSDIAQVSSLINAFTGESAAALSVDTTAIAAIISGVITECTSLGIAGAWSAVTQAITDPSVLLTAAKQCLGAVVSTGDLTSLQAMAASLSASTIRQISQTALSTYTSSFDASFYAMIGSTSAQAKAALAAIIAAFTAVDASWDLTSRNGSGVMDVSDLVGGSTGFNDLITRGVMQSAADDATAAPYLMASIEESDLSVIEELEKVYPTVTLTTGTAVVLPVSAGNMSVVAS